MLAKKDSPVSLRKIRAESVILFSVANQVFAVASEDVQEIRSTDSLAGTASVIEWSDLPKVRHTIERRRETYYVVNAGTHFGLPVTRPALVLVLRGARIAVLVDRIERMTVLSALYPLPKAFSGEERLWYRALAYVDDHVIPVIRPTALLSPEELRRLDGSARLSASQREFEGAIQE